MNLSGDLSQAEIDRLDEFLLDRVDEADTQDRDEGVLGMSELDGLLTAVVSGPEMIPPSRWMPAVWGDCEPVWESMQEAEEIFGLMMRHMNGIAVCLSTRPEDFEPMFLEHRSDGELITVVDDWCEGYIRGVLLDASAWDTGGQAVQALLASIVAFTSTADWVGHELEGAEFERVRDEITPNARALHAYWLARRPTPSDTPAEPVRREGPRVGRNDPCPCGSGRKYKKCCLS